MTSLPLGCESNQVEHKIPMSSDSREDETTERLQRSQWLRAAILGANDGLLSTTAIMLGVGAAKEDGWDMILSGLAGALAGAFSMAVGEFVSVSTQRDIEKATATSTRSCRFSTSRKNDHVQNSPPGGSMINLEAAEVSVDPKKHNAGLTSPGGRVASHQQNPKEPREEDKETVVLANPYKAAVASGLAFLSGSLLPLVSAIFIDQQAIRTVVILGVASIALVLFGCVGAHLGGSPIRVSAARVLVGGWAAMGITYGLLKPFNVLDHHKGHD